MKKQIGILGGMGPLATCSMMEKIILKTKAEKDQDYPRIYVDSNTNIPDRTKAILTDKVTGEKGENPVPYMLESGKKLQEMGADFLIMPCNTAHYFHKDIAKGVEIPILHMVEETAKFISKQGILKVGLLATSGTIETGLYTDFLKQHKIDVIIPKEVDQEKVMAMIYNGIKAGNLKFKGDDFKSVVNDLLEQGAETLILGCTELPIAWQRYNLNAPSVDPMDVISTIAVIEAGCQLS